MKRGMIYLMSRDGEQVTGRGYDSVPDRKKIIEHWRKMYAAKYYNCILQIAPQVDITRVRADGTNSKKHKPELA